MKFRDDIEPRDLGAAFCGKRHRHLDRGFGEGRPAGGHQQMLEQTFIPAARPVRLDVLPGACRLNQAHLNQGDLFQDDQLYEACRSTDSVAKCRARTPPKLDIFNRRRVSLLARSERTGRTACGLSQAVPPLGCVTYQIKR